MKLIEYKYITGRSEKEVCERIGILKAVYVGIAKDFQNIHNMLLDLDIDVRYTKDYDVEILEQIQQAINNNRIELSYLRGD